MKEEVKKYLESETEVNKRAIHISKIFIPIYIGLIIFGLALTIFGLIKAISV